MMLHYCFALVCVVFGRQWGHQGTGCEDNSTEGVSDIGFLIVNVALTIGLYATGGCSGADTGACTNVIEDWHYLV